MSAINSLNVSDIFLHPIIGLKILTKLNPEDFLNLKLSGGKLYPRYSRKRTVSENQALDRMNENIRNAQKKINRLIFKSAIHQHPDDQFEANQKMRELFFNKGLYAQAERTVRSHENAFYREISYGTIINFYIEKGLFDRVETFVKSIDDLGLRDLFITQLFKTFIKNDYLQRSETLIQFFQSPETKSKASQKLANIYFELGRIEDSERVSRY